MNNVETGRPHRPWYARVGPGLITACVVIGPGSILTSSRVGATYGYGMSWVVAAAVIFMTAYMTMGARVGVMSGRTATELLVERAGRWLAVLVGVSVFFIASSFQFGNNLGVHSAFQIYFDFDYIVVVFNAFSIAFLFAARHLYRTIERLMMLFVGLMLLSFLANLLFSRPDPAEIARGFITRLGDMTDLSLLGLIGTTFIATAAYYQSHLVRQKGWGPNQLHDGLLDARIGSAIMALITLMIMWTAASVLGSRQLESVADVARQLEPLFGQTGQALFCVGLFSAAYSSFLVNSMIGGFVLASALGLGNNPSDFWPRALTTAVLLLGMGVALYVIKTGVQPVGAIVAAQAVTVVAAPLMAGALLWLSNSRAVMGDESNGPVMNLVAGAGFLVLLAMAGYTAVEKVWPAVQEWFAGGAG